MEKEILEQYNKVKDILSKEEFLEEMEEIRPEFEDLPFMNDIDIAKEVVKNHIGVSEISKSEDSEETDSSFEEVVMTDELLEKYNQIKEFISEDEFLEEMNKLKKENSEVSFMNEETFADQIIGRYVEKENKILTDEEEYSSDNIGLLEDGDKDKSFVGIVTTISNPRSFKTRKGNSGKVCNVDVEDKTGKIRVVLWTENIKHLKNISEGDIVHVGGVDIKDGYSGLEATMRPRSVFEKAIDADPNDYPTYTEEITPIKDVEADTKVNVIARITRIPPVRSYNKNGKDGKVASLELQDASGTISYTLWNNNVDLIESLDLHDGDTVKILQAQVRERNDEKSLSHWDGRIIKGDYDVPDFVHEISKIGDLDDGDSDVSIIGVVTKIQDIRKFIRKSDQSEGQLRNFNITDDTGSIRVTLWGDSAGMDINKRDIVKLIGGNVVYDEYTEEGHSINTNFSTQITVNPNNLTDDEISLFDSIREKLQPISVEQILLTDEENVDVDVMGRIMSVGDVKTFERPSDGTEGRVRSVSLSDGTEVIQLSLWDDKCDIELNVGDAYLIENARVRFTMDSKVSLNIGSSSRIIKLSEDEAKFLPSFDTLEKMIYEYREISDLDEYDENIFVVGRIFEVFDARELERDDGSKYSLRNIEIADNSQAIRVSLWGDNAKREFDEGEAIKIQNPRVDLYNDQLTLNVSESTAIVKPSDEELMNLPSFEELKEAIYVPKEIEAIEDNDVNVRVTGTLQEVISERLLIRKCPNCGNNIGDIEIDGETTCDFCGESFDEPRTTIMIPTTLVDDTGEIGLTFFDNLVEDLLEMPKDEIINIVSDDPGALDGKIEDLEGITVEVIANVSYDEYNEVRKLNPRKILQKYY
ncbi:OB-fold nucleic acid binding domain-containing protein [Methanobrevibacter sp.]|uniref:OB-fold nucleic acid binding domain-containing protein n=1 Tax=Methanobrevibacter sp. TaxID=66852 RepID=UPI0025EEBB0B|nr:OB-fold nucleic acid binding domain-containing protein [Methanobrevibacter sp.]MEE0024617.1 OB-fold nucleic acid binding domain-containing protein [Methanobrevibacter sp.]